MSINMSALQEELYELFNQGKYSIILKMLNESFSSSTSHEEKQKIRHLMAEAYYGKRDFKRAKCEAEMILSNLSDTDDFELKGDVENLLGKIFRIYQKYEEALKHYKQAEKYFKTINHSIGLSKIYNNIGNIYLLFGNIKKAKTYHFESLKIAEKLKDVPAIASSHLNIGSLYYQDGEVDKALSYFQTANNHFQEINDLPSLATVNLNLAEVYILRNDMAKAEECAKISVELYTQIINSAGTIVSLKTLARIQKANNKIEEAINTLKCILEEEPQILSEDVLLELGNCYLLNSELGEAKNAFEQILNLSNKSDKGVVFALDSLAKIAIDTKEYQEAKSLFIQLIEVLEKMKPLDEASLHATKANLGYIFLKLKEINFALNILEETKKFYWKIKDFDEFLIVCSNYRDGLVELEAFSAVISVLKKYLIPTINKMKNDEIKNQAIFELAFIQHLIGNSESALNLWSKNKRDIKPSFKLPMLSIPTLSPSLSQKLEKEHKIFLKLIESQF
ncbi:MAG: hypothetical protein EAX86_03965 [Candidatus Heimdallarchaeota archaeon]|nr:hypothetical protein [Candidatus Heimdallarchaeota archaeon]